MKTRIAGIVLALAATHGLAQTYPSKPIRIVVGFAPGGAADLSARIVARALPDKLGQPVVVENRSGAAGLIANEVVAKAPPDGYTLLSANSSMSSIPALYPKSTFDARRDLVPVALVCVTQNVLVVHPSVPARTVKELIALGKKNPGRLNFSTSGAGGSTHISAELFKSMAGVDFTHVPYKGQSLAIAAAVAGEVDLTFNSIGPTLLFINNGRLRPLGTTGAKRSTLLPNVPTIAEAGVPGHESGSWYGFAAPAKTPPEIVVRLGDAIVSLLNDPAFVEQIRTILGAEPVGMTSQAMGAFMAKDTEKVTRIITQLGFAVIEARDAAPAQTTARS